MSPPQKKLHRQGDQRQHKDLPQQPGVMSKHAQAERDCRRRSQANLQSDAI